MAWLLGLVILAGRPAWANELFCPAGGVNHVFFPFPPLVLFLWSADVLAICQSVVSQMDRSTRADFRKAAVHSRLHRNYSYWYSASLPTNYSVAR